MKNSYLFLFSLLINLVLPAMEMEMKQVDSNKNISKIQSKKVLNLDKNIEEYVHQSFNNEEWNIDEILKKSKFATAATRKAILSYRDKNGNTITHLLVMHKKPDALFLCAQKDLILTVKNKDDLTPEDLAAENYSDYINNSKFQNKSDEECCYSILVNSATHSAAWCPFCCSECCWCCCSALCASLCGFGLCCMARDDFKHCCNDHSFLSYEWHQKGDRHNNFEVRDQYGFYDHI